MTVTAAEREERAREVLAEITPAGTFGDLISETVEEDGIFTLLFAATMGGYPGWHWAVSLAELEGEHPTVLETELMPGEGALLAPDWVPWSERLEEYRAAQAAAGEPDETVDLTDVESDDDDDFGDDPDDGIDFESDSVALAVSEHEQDEPEAEADEHSPEPPAVPARKNRRQKQQQPGEGDEPQD